MRFPILHEFNLAKGANIVNFHGWQMPISYVGIKEECEATRKSATIFDVSHMGRWLFRGAKSELFLNYLTTNDLSALKKGRAIYTTMLNEQGGIIDDLVIYKLDLDLFLLINNAGNHERVSDWFKQEYLKALKADSEINISASDLSYEDISSKIGQIAIQGPLAKEITDEYFRAMIKGEAPYQKIPYFSHSILQENGHVAESFTELLNGRAYLISATGYTGEAGYEVYAKPEFLVKLVTELCLVNKNISPAGLGARDLLRLEAGYCLHGNDIDEETTPYEAGLDWVVKLNKGNFIGKESCTRQNKILRGLIFPENLKLIPRAHTEILNDANNSEVVGIISSGAFSFTLKRAIALAYISDPNLKKVSIKIRKEIFSASIAEPWFYRNIRGTEIQLETS